MLRKFLNIAIILFVCLQSNVAFAVGIAEGANDLAAVVNLAQMVTHIFGSAKTTNSLSSSIALTATVAASTVTAVAVPNTSVIKALISSSVRAKVAMEVSQSVSSLIVNQKIAAKNSTVITLAPSDYNSDFVPSEVTVLQENNTIVTTLYYKIN